MNLNRHKITVNSVQARPVDTGINPVNGEWSDFLKSNKTLARYGSADDIAAVASPDAGYISGAVINVDSKCLA